MNEYAALGVVGLTVGGIGALVWFSYRAGSKAAAVSASAEAAAVSSDTVTVAQAMTAAQTGRPADEAALISRLQSGNA